MQVDLAAGVNRGAVGQHRDDDGGEAREAQVDGWRLNRRREVSG